MTSMIDDILTITELDQNDIELNISEVNCLQLMQQSVNEVMCYCGADVQLRIDHGCPDNVLLHTDARRVRQILTNLLVNAEKNTTEGYITLSSHFIDRQHMQFAVTDTGTGIPADKAEVIFERFEKLDSYKQGTGLGLTICRMLATHLNGEVYLDTSYTAGARFILQLPLNMMI